MGPVQLLVNQHVHAVYDTCVLPRPSSMSFNSLERVPRPGLRSAVSPAVAPPRSLSQGAATSHLSADFAAHDDPRLPGATSAASVDFGSPHRPRVRTPLTPAVQREPGSDLLRATQLEAENVGLRCQLAMAAQLADSAQKYADLQASTDATIQQLLRDRETRAPPILPRANADTAVYTHAVTMAMTNLGNYVANPTLIANVALGAVVTVKRVNDACTALLRLLGTLRGAVEYERYLRYILQLPKPGTVELGAAFADSALCLTLDTVFHNTERPSSPDGSSNSVSGTNCQRLIAARAARVASVLGGDLVPAGDGLDLLDSFMTVDSLLYTHIIHLVSAVPGTAVYDSVSDATTFVGAVAGLLRCAGHGADQDRQLRYERAFGACVRHTLNRENVSELTTEQLPRPLNLTTRADFPT